MRLVVLVAALTVLTGGSAVAQASGPLEDTSSVEANGHRIIQLSVEVPAPRPRSGPP